LQAVNFIFLVAIHRWRSTSVDAVFQLNDSEIIESQVNGELTREVVLSLEMAFGISPDQLTVVFEGQKSAVLKLSAMLVNYSRLLITVAPTSSAIIGTYSFGLQRRIGSDHITLIELKAILPSVFYDSSTVGLTRISFKLWTC
jgi:hypothetical protein